MSSTSLVDHLKTELKAAGMGYAQLAKKLGMAESSIKRMLSPKGHAQLTLAKIDAICKVLRLDFADLAKRVTDHKPLLTELTHAQERSVVQDERLLLVAICALSQWTVAQVVETYRITEAQCIAALAKLDRLGLIELKPQNRYSLKLAKTFRWQPDGAVMQYFRAHVVGDYFAGSFAKEIEGLYLVHGSINKAAATDFLERLQRLGQEFSTQHLSDQKLPASAREGITLVLGMREWEFQAFRQLRR